MPKRSLSSRSSKGSWKASRPRSRATTNIRAQLCVSSAAHPIFATAHVPATTEPTKSTQPSTWRDEVPLQLHLSHHGESRNRTSIVALQSPPTSTRYHAISPRRLSQPRHEESIG